MDASKAVTADFVTIAACETSAVASITPNGYAFAQGFQGFDVVCQNGRYGGIRLPRGSSRDKLQACAFQQSNCDNAANKCLTTLPSSTDLEIIYLRRENNHSNLLDDKVLGPLATWVCQ